jgi:hypothetical protein
MCEVSNLSSDRGYLPPALLQLSMRNEIFLNAVPSGFPVFFFFDVFVNIGFFSNFFSVLVDNTIF